MSDVNDLIRRTPPPADPDTQAARLVDAATAAKFHNPQVALDLVPDADRADPAAAVRALVAADPSLVRRTSAGAGAGNSADARPSAQPQGQHPFSDVIRRHWQGG